MKVTKTLLHGSSAITAPLLVAYHKIIEELAGTTGSPVAERWLFLCLLAAPAQTCCQTSCPAHIADANQLLLSSRVAKTGRIM